jgi:hypothetical protein
MTSEYVTHRHDGAMTRHDCPICNPTSESVPVLSTWWDDAHGEVVLLSDATDAIQVAQDAERAASAALRTAAQQVVDDMDDPDGPSYMSLSALRAALTSEAHRG